MLCFLNNGSNDLVLNSLLYITCLPVPSLSCIALTTGGCSSLNFTEKVLILIASDASWHLATFNLELKLFTNRKGGTGEVVLAPG